MTFQECLLDLHITFADFREHPLHGFVNEVVPVREQKTGNFQSIWKVILPNEVKG